ncbi:MAG: hypothetical protein HYT03_03460 [Candidatus Harrisonbacteria bacterium]|nr:hypothetical protein [Candidatus Harrisonbacteria bacterium]
MKIDVKRFINPEPPVGGLEVSDQTLRYLRIDGGRLKQSLIQLPPGVISGGAVKDKPKLVSSLKALHRQIELPKKSLHVVLVMPSHRIYTQTFALPPTAVKNLEETAKLNLEMISPIDAATSYRSYQMLSTEKSGKLEALGAFVPSKDVDDYLDALQQANFAVLAVEFLALSLARLIKEYGVGVNPNNPYLVINLSSDGPNLTVVKNNNPYFSYFVPWSSLREEIGAKKVSTKEVLDSLDRQVRQITTFYSSRWGEPIRDILLINSPIAKDIIADLKKVFDLNIQFLTIAKFGHLSPLWIGALGGALRGLIPRYKDRFISLTAIGVEKSYYRELTINFIKSWRNLIGLVLGFMVLVLFIGNVFLVRGSDILAKDLESRGLVPLDEVRTLQEAAQAFNQSVDFVDRIKQENPPWSPFLNRIKVLGGARISFDRVSIDPNLNAIILGRASSDASVIAFKNTLEKEPNFSNVTLPLTSIKANADGTVSFNITFRVTSLIF